MINETISVDAGPAIGALDELAAAAAKADEAMAKLKMPSLSGSGAGNMAKGVDAAAAKVQAAVDKMEASFAKLKTVGAEAGAAMGDIGKAGAKSAAGLADASKAANDAAAANARLRKTAAEASVAMDEQAVAGKRAAKSSAEGAAASEGFFSRHKELILGTGLALGYAVDKAMKFNGEITLLQTQAGVSAKQMPQLTKGVLELAGQVGQSPGNLAESLFHVESNMSSLGITAPKALQLVKIAAEGASTGHANLVDTTNALTSVVASGIPGVKNYSQAMGVLNATVGSGDMSMQQLADSMASGVVPIVKGYGLNIKDVGAALATFGDLNIRGAQAGTDLRTSVQALAVPAKSGAAELKALGLSQKSLSKDMESGGLLKALDDLTGRFKAHGINAKNMGGEITDLFGKKAGPGLAVLLENMDRLNSKYPELTKNANNFGAAWSRTLETPQQKLNNLVQGTQALAITAGNVLMPYANKALGGLDTGLQWLQQHSLANKGLALGAGALVVGGIGKGLFSGVESSLAGLGKIGSALKIPGLDKLANIGKGAGLDGAAAGLDGAGASLRGAAAELSGAAAKLGGEGLAGGAAGKAKGAAAGAEGAAAGAAGAAEGEAAAAGASRLKAPAMTAGVGALAALTVVDPILRSMSSGPGGKNWFENPFGMAGPHDKGSSGNWLTSFSPYERLFRQTSAPAPPPAMQSGQSASFTGRFGPSSAPEIKPKIAAPDTSAVSGAAAKIKAELDGALGAVTGKKVKLPAPDMSGLQSAKGKAQADAQAITSAITGALGKPVHAKSPDLSAYASAAGAARGDGAAISAGLASGILGGMGAAVAAARQVAAAVSSAMAGALQVRSPSRVTQKIGAQAAQGLVVGLEGGQSAVDAAATAIGRNVAKAADIASIDNTTKKLLGQVPAGHTALTRMLEADNRALDRMANTRAKLEAEIGDSEQVAKSVISGASIMNSLNAVNPAGAEPLASSAVVTGQQYQASSMKQFAQSLMQLQKMGLNATSLSQIAQAGPDQGLGIAQGIAGGGKSAITQLNQLQKQMQSSAAQIGNVAGPAMYQAGKDAGQGLAAGLKSELGSLDKAMEKLAQAMVASVSKHTATAKKAVAKAAAGTASGAAAASGAASGAGQDSGAASLVHAGAALSGAAAALTGAAAALKRDAPGGGPRVPAHPAGGHGAGYLPSGGGQHVHYHTHVTQNVQGSIHAMNDLVDGVQNGLLVKGQNNWMVGIIPHGRAG